MPEDRHSEPDPRKTPPDDWVGPVLAGFWQKAGAWVLPADRDGGNYRDLLRARWADLGFCFLFIFLSGYGQTFVLSIFQPYWREALGLSMAAMGLIYSVATLGSAVFLPAAGRWLDHTSSERAAKVCLLGLAAGALVALFSLNIWILGCALLLLRFFGQGLSATLGMTRAAQWFEVNRGKAVSVSSLGFPFAEALMPLGVTLLVLALTWQGAWVVLLLLCPLAWAPLSLYLLRQRRLQQQRRPASVAVAAVSAAAKRRLLTDWRFYAMLGITAPVPFIGTGVIFFQATIAELRGWSAVIFPAGFIFFALSRALFAIIAGAWVDKIGSMRMLILPTLLFATGLLLLSVDALWCTFLFFAAMGIGFGASSGIMISAWTDLFGSHRIGLIRGLSGSVGVVATALAPFIFGLAFDSGLGLSAILLVCASLMLTLALPLCFMIRRSQH